MNHKQRHGLFWQALGVPLPVIKVIAKALLVIVGFFGFIGTVTNIVSYYKWVNQDDYKIENYYWYLKATLIPLIDLGILHITLKTFLTELHEKLFAIFPQGLLWWANGITWVVIVLNVVIFTGYSFTELSEKSK